MTFPPCLKVGLELSLVFTILTIPEARPAPPPPVPHRVDILFPTILTVNFPSNNLEPVGAMVLTPSQVIVPTSDSVCNSHNLEGTSVSQAIASPSKSPLSSPTHHQSQIIVSTNGNIYPTTMFPLSLSHLDVYVKQMLGLSKLKSLFPVECLKQHNFEWNVKLDKWLPLYDFWKPSASIPPNVDQIWEEYTKGIDNPKSLSILELTATWGGHWKWNIKTESSKQKKIVDLIQALSN